MLYLIEYDRESRRIVRLESFENSARALADATRLEIELDLNRRGVQREVVILEAAGEDALRQTHRRYFQSFASIAREAGLSGD